LPRLTSKGTVLEENVCPIKDVEDNIIDDEVAHIHRLICN
jgi:hypothetical protein